MSLKWVFFGVLLGAAGLFALSSTMSLLGAMSSQPSDVGIVAGAMFVSVLMASVATLGVWLYKKIQVGKSKVQGADKPEDKP